jgi:hypothetical protein
LPNWSSGLEEVLWVVLLVAFGPALGRRASASLRRMFLLASGLFAATFFIDAVRSGVPMLEWCGFVRLVVSSLIWVFGLLVILAILSAFPVRTSSGAVLRRMPGRTGRRA